MTKVNLTADGNTAVFKNQWNDNLITIVAEGTFGSGTIEAEVSGDETAFVGLGTDAQLSADGAFNIRLSKGMSFRINLSGATNPDIDVNIIGEGFNQ